MLHTVRFLAVVMIALSLAACAAGDPNAKKTAAGIGTAARVVCTAAAAGMGCDGVFDP